MTFCSVIQDAYEELVEMVGSKRSGLNQSLVLKAQYERALQDLLDLVDTAQDKMAADQKMKVGSVIEVQILLDKHKVPHACYVCRGCLQGNVFSQKQKRFYHFCLFTFRNCIF